MADDQHHQAWEVMRVLHLLMPPHGMESAGGLTTERWPMFKNCSSCKEPKTLDQFCKRASSKDGLESYCRACAAVKNRKYRATHLEEERIAKRKWCAANPERQRTTKRKWREATRDARRAYGREFYAANVEEQRELKHEWVVANRDQVNTSSRIRQRAAYAANPEVEQLKQHLRRARKKANGIFLVTPKDVKRLKSVPCYLCEVAPSATLDHIIPLERDGRHSIGNLLGACLPCNDSKGYKYLVEFKRMRRQRRLTSMERHPAKGDKQ